jgi:phosphoglycolate phosphatase-like HAD superfamily hydrolase
MKDCWIFDMDGTLCNSDHRKHFLEGPKKDWAGWFRNMDKDPVHEDIADFYNYAVERNIPVFICTGRDEGYRSVSQFWLDQNGIFVNALLMRGANDRRDDSVVKKEMLDELRALNYNPVMVFEDRDRVVKMWRENGVRCMQVANGDF